MKSAGEILALVDIAFAVPLVLLMNYSLFQYLVTTFWQRRQERRVRLLLFIAFLSCASLIPFAFPDRELGRNLNDVSEVCSVMTFLMQITLLTRDVSKRLRIRSIRVLMWSGELLVVASLAMLLVNVVYMVAPVIKLDAIDLLDNVIEVVSLAFIVSFRFYFLAMVKGYKKVWATQKRELLFYMLFLTHEVPFDFLKYYTQLDWERIQALWMRTTITMCLSTTVTARLSSVNSKKVHTSTKLGQVGPSQRLTSKHKSAGEPETYVVPLWTPVAVAPTR